jgi:hypothetical protein
LSPAGSARAVCFANRGIRLQEAFGGVGTRPRTLHSACLGSHFSRSTLGAHPGGRRSWGIGLDIACRLRLSVFGLSSHVLGQKRGGLRRALEEETFFGAGVRHDGRSSHEVLDDPAWGATRFLRGLKDTARVQLGTSGSGNHFVEFGTFDVPEDLGPAQAAAITPLEPGHSYLALLSHSGSRGVGKKICDRYSKVAEERRPGLEGEAKKLAWLELSSEEGQEYWLSMRLAGRFAAANHAVIHERIARRISAEAAFVTEHHHNFAFAEEWRGEEMIVHRKGATPADPGGLGIVPGTMADPGYLTMGLGVDESLNSASHGAAHEPHAGLQGSRWGRLACGSQAEGDHPARGCARRGARCLQGPARRNGLPGRPGGGRRGVLTRHRAHGCRIQEGPASPEEEPAPANG